MKRSQIPISVICLVGYDVERVFESLESYYDYADEIIFGIEQQRVSMTMNPIEVPKELFERIKDYPKVRVVQDAFYSHQRTPMENDTYQRNRLSLLTPPGNWIVQIDSDEVLLNPQEFFEWLARQPEEDVLITATWISLFKEVKGRWMVICTKDRRAFNRELFPVATRRKNAYVAARYTQQKRQRSPLRALHYSWVRSEEALWRKLHNWSHAHDFDQERFFRLWQELHEANYTTYTNFHPLHPPTWPALAYQSKEEIFMQVERELNAGRWMRTIAATVNDVLRGCRGGNNNRSRSSEPALRR